MVPVDGIPQYILNTFSASHYFTEVIKLVYKLTLLYLLIYLTL